MQMQQGRDASASPCWEKQEEDGSSCIDGVEKMKKKKNFSYDKFALDIQKNRYRAIKLGVKKMLTANWYTATASKEQPVPPTHLIPDEVPGMGCILV